VAAVVGGLLGVSYAFVADTYDHTLRTTDQAERYFGLNVLTSIPEVSGGVIRK
jgi:capsular polysaccharide biosynthesis protein